MLNAPRENVPSGVPSVRHTSYGEVAVFTKKAWFSATTIEAIKGPPSLSAGARSVLVPSAGFQAQRAPI